MRRIFSALFVITILTLPLFSEDIGTDETENAVEEINEAEQTQTGEPAQKKSEEPKDESSIVEEQGYNLKLRNLEESINSLKDKIFRSKQRLAILQETVISGSIAGARAKIIHRNNVGGAFNLISAIYYLDDAPVYKRINQADDLAQKEITVFESSVVPGPHHISAYFVYQGRGFGIFSYMKGYTFKIRSGHSFIVEEGNIVEISVSPNDRGSSHKIEERLFITFDVAKKMYQAEFGKEPEISQK